MKRIYYTLTICFGLIFLVACTDGKDVEGITDSMETVEPGTYIVGINLGVETPLTKGINSNNLTFNNVYESNVIYLHKIVNGEEAQCIEIPVHTYDCQNPDVMNRCNGFIYQIEKQDNGSVTITALNADRSPIEGQTMTVNENDSFYFSSIPGRNWSVPEKNQESYTPPTETIASTNELYKREKDKNVEIYRSVNNFEGIDELISSAGDLELERKCSGFTFSALFIDIENKNGEDNEDFSILTEDEFQQVMKDSYKNWYIKVYIGPMFTSKYDMQNETGAQEEGGFYASSDRDTYLENGIDNGLYTQFRQAGNGNTQSILRGYGYNSYNDNYLFSPTNETYAANNLRLYIYIKHWTGSGDPTTEWLSSDEGAMYTQITGSQVTSVTVKDGVFYECGATIDIRELYAAAVANDLITEGGTSTANAISISASSGAPKKFTLHNAETFIRY